MERSSNCNSIYDIAAIYTAYRHSSDGDSYDMGCEMRSSSPLSGKNRTSIKQYGTDDRKSYIYYFINKNNEKISRDLSIEDIGIHVSSVESD